MFHRLIYSPFILQYSQREAVDEAWRKIGAELKVKDVKVLREKWRNFRTVFLRRWKTEGTNRNKSSYYLMDEMKFLIDFVKISVPLKSNEQRVSRMESSSSPTKNPPAPDQQLYTIVQLPAEENKSDLELFQEKLDGTYDDQTTYIPTKQEHQQQQQQQHFSLTATDNEFLELSPGKSTVATPTDPRKLFFLSIAPEMDKLTDRQFRKFRKLTLDFLDACEDGDS